jgi:transcriptional regulator with XRE-family HTH domain
VIRLHRALIRADDRQVASLHDTLSNNIRGERARRRMTQKQLAEQCGWPRTAIHDVEIGRRKLTLDEMACLCRAFGCDLAELVRGGNEDDLHALGIVRR